MVRISMTDPLADSLGESPPALKEKYPSVSVIPFVSVSQFLGPNADDSPWIPRNWDTDTNGRTDTDGYFVFGQRRSRIKFDGRARSDFEAVLVDDPVEARFASVVEEQSELQIARAEVPEGLCVRVLRQSFTRFDLDDQFLIDDHVNGLRGKGLPAVIDHHRYLAFDPVPLCTKIPLERQRVDVLAKTEAESAMYVEK